MGIYSVLKHRAAVKRSVTTYVDGYAVYSWATITENLPCLLDAYKRDEGQVFEFERADRVGLLMTSQTADIKTGDRVAMTRGPIGTFVIKGDPDERPTLHGISHREFAVSEVG